MNVQNILLAIVLIAILVALSLAFDPTDKEKEDEDRLSPVLLLERPNNPEVKKEKKEEGLDVKGSIKVEIEE